MKKAVSFFTVWAMLFGLIAAVPQTASAQGELVYSSDLTSLDGWRISKSSNVDVYLEDGGIVLYNTNGVPFTDYETKTVNSKLTPELVRGLYTSTVDGNGATVTSQSFTGKVAVEMDIAYAVDTHPERGLETRFMAYFGYCPDPAAPASTEWFGELRLHKSSMGFVNRKDATTNYSGGSMKTDVTPVTPGENMTVTVVLDLENGVMNGKFGDNDYIASNYPFVYNKTGKKIFNLIRFVGMEASDTGSYLKISRIGVYQIEDEDPRRAPAQNALLSLPDSLTDDGESGSIALPAVSGGAALEWVSGNPAILANDGRLNRPASDTEVTMTAKVSCAAGGEAPVVYTKSYTVMVMAGESEPEPDPEPGAGVLCDYIYNKSLEDIPNFKSQTDGYSTVDIENGALTFRHINSLPYTDPPENKTNNSAFTFYGVQDLEFALDRDAENNTELITSQLLGKHVVEMEIEPFLATDRATTTYVNLRLGYRTAFTAAANALPDNLVEYRINANGTMVAYHANASGGKTQVIGSYSYTQGEKFLVRTEMDNVNRTFNCYINGNLQGSLGAPYYFGGLTGNIFSSIQVSGMQATKTGSYFKIYSVKVSQDEQIADDGLTAAFAHNAALPAALAPDPSAVTQSLSLPEDTEEIGAVWSSSNSLVLSSGGEVTRWVEDVPVTMSAAFNTMSSTTARTLNFKKNYNMTVKAREDAENTLLMSEPCTQDSERIRFDLDGASASHAFSEQGLTLSKTADGQETPAHMTGAAAAIALTTEVESDAYSRLLLDNHRGIYDLEAVVTPYVSGIHPCVLQAGYTDPATGDFAPLASVNLFENALALGSATLVGDATAGRAFALKLRMDTQNKKMWLYKDGRLISSAQGAAYTDSANIGLINTLSIALDENAPAGDRVRVKNVNLTRKLPAEAAIVKNLLQAARSIAVSSLTDDPQAMGGTLKALPASVGGFNVEWFCDNPYALDVETKKIYRAPAPQDIVLTARLTGTQAGRAVAVTKEFFLTVAPTSDLGEILQTEAQLLVWSEITRQPANAVRHDLLLPSGGKHGASVSWRSSNEQIVDNAGRINKNVALSGGADAVLTATIQMGGQSAQKSFPISVRERGVEMKALDISPNLAPIQGCFFDLGGLTNAFVSGEALYELTVSKADCHGDALSLVDRANAVAASLAFDGNNLIYDGQTIAQIADAADAVLKILVMPDAGKLSIWANGQLALEYADIHPKATSRIAGVKSSSGKITLKKAAVYLDDFAIFQLNLDMFPYFTPLPAAYLTRDVELKTDSALGATVEWRSSDPSVLTDAGVFTRPENFAFVDLRFSIRNANAELARTVNLVAMPGESANLAKGKTVSSTTLGNAATPISNLIDGNMDTYYTATALSGTAPSFTVAFEKDGFVNAMFVGEAAEGIDEYSLHYSNDGEKWIALKSGRFTDLSSRLISFDTISPRFLRLTADTRLSARLDISEILLFLIADEVERARLDVSAISLDTTEKLIHDAALPNRGRYGTPISWISSNSDLVSDSGVVRMPKYDEPVTLTAYAVAGGERFENPFDFIVAGEYGPRGASVVQKGSSSGGGRGGAAMPAPAGTSAQTPAQTPAADGAFGDVPVSHWAHEYIKALKARGIVSGDGENRFNPEGSITREQFLKMLVAARGVALSDVAGAFSDVDGSAWYAPYVGAGISAGIVSGVSDTQFGIGRNITRQDMAVMVARALGAPASSDGGAPFDDDGAIAPYAVEAVYSLRALGIVRGFENRFAPEDLLSRAEAAAIISALADVTRA